jgi:4-hydroxythreonine-4-phosphate dehydrogenase
MASGKIVFGISCGDVNGVGVEIIIKAFLDGKLLQHGTPVLYAPLAVIKFYQKTLGYTHFDYNEITQVQDAKQNQFNVINISCDKIIVTPGKASKLSGEVALNSLDYTIRDLKLNLIDILVTLPINKKTVSFFQNNFVGHTEYLLQNFDSQNNCLMFLCSNQIKVATLTNHTPISTLADCITPNLLKEKIEILLESLRKDFLLSKPRIAVLGLNPHAGDSGLIGLEELKIIEPAVKSFSASGDLVYGPYSADAFFGSGNYKNFDAVLGMYHDQSLIPFKFLSFGSGVNYTAGLPVIRVSPDHGVAYDIAGLGKADPNSLIASIYLAIKIYNNRLNSFKKR